MPSSDLNQSLVTDTSLDSCLSHFLSYAPRANLSGETMLYNLTDEVSSFGMEDFHETSSIEGQTIGGIFTVCHFTTFSVLITEC
jgi:hypothetical protein